MEAASSSANRVRYHVLSLKKPFLPVPVEMNDPFAGLDKSLGRKKVVYLWLKSAVGCHGDRLLSWLWASSRCCGCQWFVATVHACVSQRAQGGVSQQLVFRVDPVDSIMTVVIVTPCPITLYSLYQGSQRWYCVCDWVLYHQRHLLAFSVTCQSSLCKYMHSSYISPVVM